MPDAQVNEPDLREELDECLEILGEATDHWHWGAPHTEELATALWQTVELVTLLLADNDSAWGAVGFLRTLTDELQQKLQERDRIWTPGQGGSSGPQRSRRARRPS